MKAKKYLAVCTVENEFNFFDTIEEARKWIEEFVTDEDGISEDHLNTSHIFELRENASYKVVDSKSNYKYMSEEDVPESEEEDSVWPYNSEYEEIWEIIFKAP